jgi:prepilin-type N-terminal cleavage/methylation domain-containing protein
VTQIPISAPQPPTFKQRGFTIVELLIVSVFIGILATTTIVEELTTLPELIAA